MIACEHPTIVILGQLGSSLWGRCRNCGIDVRTEDTDQFDVYEHVLAELDEADDDE